MIDFNAFLESFKVMGVGMTRIFMVIILLMPGLWGLTKIFPEKKDKPSK